MKINPSSVLLTCGIALTTTLSWAQTTPTGTVNSTTYPQGAVAPDSAKPASRDQKRMMRQNRRATNQDNQTNGTTTNTSMQNARSQQSGASDGAANNNTNQSNYNSNNATNPATGVGSNPNTTAVQSTQTGSQSGQSSMSGSNSQATTVEATSNAGAVEAVKGAKTSEIPAVKAGSTVRNTSISDFVASSPNFTTLQNAIQSADLVETLKGTGPYTVFAPTNDAFKKLPTAVQGGLLDGSHKDALKQLLSYHVVSGTINSTELSRQIKAGNGTAQLKTLAGSTLTAKEANGRVSLTDEQGNTVQVEGAGNPQSNGMIYRIDSVLMPKNASFR